MSVKALLLLMLTHVLFDWIVQDRETAKKKSSKLSYLIPHLFLIYVGLSLYSVFSDAYSGLQGFYFALLNTILHGIIDWNIWKVYKYSVLKRFPGVDVSFPYQEDAWFYNFIAIDQLLHGLCYLGIHVLVTKGFLS